jgi:hypothetical protein
MSFKQNPIMFKDQTVYDDVNEEIVNCSSAKCQNCTRFQLELCEGYDAYCPVCGTTKYADFPICDDCHQDYVLGVMPKEAKGYVKDLLDKW